MKPRHFGIARSFEAVFAAAKATATAKAAAIAAAQSLAVAAVLLFTASSCAKIEQMQDESPLGLAYNVALEQPSSLNKPQAQSASLEQPLTKAASSYNTTDTFKSWAWYLPEGKNWSADKANALAYFSNVTVAFNTDKWEGEGGPYFWPKKGSLSFISLSPASVAQTGNLSVDKYGVTLNNWKLNATTNQDIDFMIADFKSDLKTNTNTYGYLGVPTLFRHKLAKITVQASTASAPSATNVVKLYKVSLRNVYTRGTYTPDREASGTTAAASESWSRSEVEEVVIFQNNSGLELDLTAQNVTLNGKDLLVIPQILNAVGTTRSDVSLYVEYSINSTTHSTADKKLTALKSYLWGIGQHITYSIVIGEENEPIEFDAGVSGCESGSSSDISIGEK